jgi:hypothetical protein
MAGSPSAGELPPQSPAVVSQGTPIRNPPQRSRPSSRRGPKKAVSATVIGVILLAAVVAAIFYIRQSPPPSGKPGLPMAGATPDPERHRLSGELEEEARSVLKQLIAGTTVAQKLPYVLDGPRLADDMEAFYGGTLIDDSDTPAEIFSVYELLQTDLERGIFLMEFDRPPQFALKEFFRPLATAEVQYGLEDPGILLSHIAQPENFTLEPVRVFAFFKRTPEGLKIDWEVFAQTKYRTLLNFVELPSPGQREVFRVYIFEDVPEPGRDVPGYRTYRVADPANPMDSARVRMKEDSKIGKELSVINWRGSTSGNQKTPTATIELAWTRGDGIEPELTIQRFICWEFLGIGGEANPIENPR